jgi:hypothetical protein
MYPLRLEIMFDDENNGVIKVSRCFKDIIQTLEEMSLSEGTIIISRTEKTTSIDIIQGKSSESWIIENQ